MITVRSATERWARTEHLFGQAIELPPEARVSFIEANAADADERQELLELLASDADHADACPISQAIGRAADHSALDRKRGLLGKVVGQYRIVSILGSGGSGTVYLGERADKQYAAQVAIKVIDETAPTAFGLRFRAERQILASLNHPNIARLLDAGETESHQPFLVMEYVHGETLERYCDRNQLTVRARLELFLQVCAAVQYAHQNLIVHRDLKPANILVTDDGTPKLLDFGIAKLLDASDLTRASELTRMNDRILTPEYASPEQILGRSVTTASDVYSLGVVLYQLLTGLRPYILSSASASQLELERIICVTDPLRPSVAVRAARSGSLTEDEPSIDTIAPARGVTAHRLERTLAGDIDAIVMRSMRKEPQHRYTSVEQLLADIRRWLVSEPVQARHGNWLYYSSRFIRRNRWPVAASTTIAVLIVGGMISMSIQRAATQAALELATEQKQTAEAVSRYIRDIFAAANPFLNDGHQATARELLDEASRTIETLNAPAAVKLELYETMGIAYRRLGEPQTAVAQLSNALELSEGLHPNGSQKTASILVELAVAEREKGLADESEQHLKEGQQMLSTLGPTDARSRARYLAELGKLHTLRSQPEQALASFTSALQLIRSIQGPLDVELNLETGSILSDVANIHTWRDEYPQAEAAAREAVQIFRVAPPLHPDRVKADFILAEILFLKGKLTEAAALYESALAAQRRIFNSNPRITDTLVSLAQLRIAQGDAAGAEKLVREAIDIHQQWQSTDYTRIGFLHTMLGTVLLTQSRLPEAEQQLRRAYELVVDKLPADHQYVASAEHYFGEALLARGKLAEAEERLTGAKNRWQRTGAPAWRSARSASALGEVLHLEGRDREAEEELVASYQILSAASGVDRDTREAARARLVRFYADTKQQQKLEALVRPMRQAP
jgi:serine/threonine protein kinase/tetratricopeptide (TPR) repeat protein